MKITENLRKRFCKDFNIPINMFRDNFFMERLELLNDFYGTKRKWEIFKNEVSRYDNEQDYFEYYNKTKDDAISHIKATEGFRRFNAEDMSKFEIPQPYRNLPTKDIYHASNVGKSFVSIDITKANFSCLNFYDSEIFEHQGYWENYIGLYTSLKHIIESKYIRQVILGNCNPGRQVTYEKWIMYTLLQWIVGETEGSVRLPLEDVAMFSNDEIVLYDNGNIKWDYLMRVVGNFTTNSGIPIHVEKFKLVEFGDLAYVKLIEDDTLEIKCAKAEFLPMIIHGIQGGKIDYHDLFFMYEGELARFEDVPDKVITACERWEYEYGFIGSKKNITS